MSWNVSTPWHKASFDRFLQDRLPQLLADRLPLVGYQAGSTSSFTCYVKIVLASENGDVAVEYIDLAQPNENGLFDIAQKHCVVVPIALQEDLETAEIQCVGEQLYDYIQARIGQAPPDCSWDAALVRAWLPLDVWIAEFLSETAQQLDDTNWLSRRTHLRSVLLPNRENIILPAEFGRVCPFETPEGPNIGRILRVAVGAEIHDGKLVVVDQCPEAALGLSASMIPLLEHNDPNRLLMGANMMRQWVVQRTAEPALVQSGGEPDVPDFWIGRNLLTAFVSWGADTFADGIVVSESCARRFDTPYALEPGDKVSNRHGTKGVISRILPDDEMPHLPDGTSVDLVFNFFGLNVRMHFGQVREAVLGRIARVEGVPFVAPPFHAPSTDELRQRLIQTGLPASGMETLTMGRNGPELERPSAVGWVYWGRLFHLAQSKIKASADGGMQRQGEMECYALRDVGAYALLGEMLNTISSRHPDAATLAARMASGPIEQPVAPTPIFSDLAQRLQIAGIEMSLDDHNRLRFRFQPPRGEVHTLAHPVAHPWLPERELDAIGVPTGLSDTGQMIGCRLAPDLLCETYSALIEANDRLSRMLANQTPQKLVQSAIDQLQARVNVFFDALLPPSHLRLGERLLFSGRTVIAPGAELRIDQVALADEIAWTLFGPLVTRGLGDAEAVQARSVLAAQVLDDVMARSWVIINRAPTMSPTALLAFHPVRDLDSVIRLHPLVCEMLNADFDGDQVAVWLPVTEAGQREAGDKLSVAAHLARDPDLVDALPLPPEALWGLASLGLADGAPEIARLAGIAVAMPRGLVTQTTLAEAMRKLLARDGIDAVLAALDRLMRRGFEVVKASGASMNPFFGESVVHPPQPTEDVSEVWERYADLLTEQVLTRTDYDSADLGPQLLAVNIRARGRMAPLHHIGPRGLVEDAHGNRVVVRHGLVEGVTAAEMFAFAAAARRGLGQLAFRWQNLGYEVRASHAAPGWFTVLARARQAQCPGIVFARAAASGEIDPLIDVDSRLLVGLPVAT
ncbi:MAG: hypothetical protein JXA89_08640 [Anaerolineae bacterium]|nr:hypothetical protein [Anaerolineae bacterium]